MIKATIANKGKQITVICDSAKAVTNNSVSCYWYSGDGKVEHYDGRIIAVTTA